MNIFNAVIFWAIVITPFSVAISPALANTFIGFFCAFFVIKKVIKREPLAINKVVLLSFLAIGLISLISFINSVNIGTSLQGLVKLLKYFIIIAVCSEEIKTRRHIQLILFSVCCGLVLMSINAVWQIKFGKEFIHQIVLQSAIGMPRPTASFPNPN
ncbi:MAG: hypothetical protein NTY47_02885, partial [Candidatus Omnitrophica bacterium]|nr:hypothetical protein [Candidatus Omnitrophota bacterium]